MFNVGTEVFSRPLDISKASPPHDYFLGNNLFFRDPPFKLFAKVTP